MQAKILFKVWTVVDAQKNNKLDKSGYTYLLFPAQFQKDLFNFLSPVVLHYVKAFVRGLCKGRMNNFIQVLQDLNEGRPVMWIRFPTFWKQIHTYASVFVYIYKFCKKETFCQERDILIIVGFEDREDHPLKLLIVKRFS